MSLALYGPRLEQSRRPCKSCTEVWLLDLTIKHIGGANFGYKVNFTQNW